MSDNIISASRTNVKREIPARYYVKFSEREDIRYQIATQIMRGPLDKAQDCLRMYGFAGEFPAHLDTLAAFYGIHAKYLYRVLVANRFGVRRTPEVIWREDEQIMIDARLALACAIIMVHGRTVPANTVVRDIILRLMSSSYYDAIFEQEGEFTQLTMADNGGITISTELLTQLIKRTAKEVVQEVMKTNHPEPEPEISVTQSKKHIGRERMTKPRNWDDVMIQFNAGEIKRSEAAKRLGVSYSTFCRYAIGGRSFREPAIAG